MTSTRSFSIGLYLFIVFAFSWPFQLAFVVLGDPYRPILLLSMIMAGVGTFVAGRYVFRDAFDDAGWRWGRPRHYLLAFGLALFLWLVPVVIENVSGLRSEAWEPRWAAMLVSFMTSFSITLVPAFGEEFSWRGYLLPRLLERLTTRRALLVHGFVTWLWHVPFIVTMGFDLGGAPAVSVPLVLLVSLVPTVLHAVVFAYLWSTSGSLLVATVYHSAFDEVRDTLHEAIGFGTLAENWQAVVLTILGALLLWKIPWNRPPGRMRDACGVDGAASTSP
jgi:membrane protease YdiL (CAAX protease family)